MVSGATFSNNRVISEVPACNRSVGGGANLSGPYTIADSVFAGNSADTCGGLNGYEGSLQNTSFLGNTAIAGDGGGLCDGYGNKVTTAISVTLHANSATGDGGGAIGPLALTSSRVEGNTAGGNGGGLSGAARVESSTITGNHAANGGGISAGTMEIVASTLSGNTAVTDGGAIYVPGASRGGPIVTVRNSTLSGNSAGRQGGAFSDFGGISVSGRFTSKAHFLNTSVISNTAPLGGGGGLYHAGYYGEDDWGEPFPQDLTLENVLLSGSTGGNCAGVTTADGFFISYGHNLSSDSTCLGLTGTGDKNKTKAQIGPLQDNGGPTLTHALLAGSPAIDAGGAANCPTTDQRGVARPQGATCDIGAYEWQPTSAYLHVAPAGLSFTAVACAAPPPTQPITVTNSGAGALSWTATKNQPWLNVSPASGAAPANPSVSVNQAGLVAGMHSGSVTVSAAGAGGSPQAVNVTLSVLTDSSLARNGGFEAGPNGDWTESSANSAPLIRQAGDLGGYPAPHGGSWAALMGVVNGEVSELTQSVLVPPGVTTLLKYWVHASSTETDCDFDTALVQVNGTTVKTHPLCQSGNTAGWTQASVPLTAYGGQQVTLRFRVDNDAFSDPSVFMLDDIRLAIDPPCTVVEPVFDHFIHLPAIFR
jgi:predicted outer membrane repeat protein